MVTTIVGLALGWWIDRQARIEHQAVAELELRESREQQALLRLTVIELATAMRDDGWMVRLEANGAGGYRLYQLQNWESREVVAFQFNRQHPLPRAGVP